MLKLKVNDIEVFDEKTNRFSVIKGQEICLEHSLVSISKWESKWKKPFIDPRNPKKTDEEWFDYIKCMTVTQNVNPAVYNGITTEQFAQIFKYIDDPMTATWFNDKQKRPSREIITNELVYYWMIELGIPMECQKWHFNRLMTLIKVVSEKRKPPKKYGKRELYSKNAALNAARRAAMNSRG